MAGPAFILVFIFSAVLLAVLSDWLAARLSRSFQFFNCQDDPFHYCQLKRFFNAHRTLMLAGGTLTFSLACLFMGLSTQYWHLVILRLVTSIIAIISIAPSNDGKYKKSLSSIGLILSLGLILLLITTTITNLIIRMLIALGLSVCRPTSGALIAEVFSQAYRGVANGDLALHIML